MLYIYLKYLEESGRLLVTGPYKYNGVPLKRLNGVYALPTYTKLKLDAKVADSIKDNDLKKTELNIKEGKDFFVEEKLKKKELLKKEKRTNYS